MCINCMVDPKSLIEIPYSQANWGGCCFRNGGFLREMLARYKHEIGKSQVCVSEFVPEYACWSSGTGKAGAER